MWSKSILICLVVCIGTAYSLSAGALEELNCTRPNEMYACGSACQTRCDNLGKTCPIVNARCNDFCYCKEGYARGTTDSSPCIPIGQCP